MPATAGPCLDRAPPAYDRVGCVQNATKGGGVMSKGMSMRKEKKKPKKNKK